MYNSSDSLQYNPQNFQNQEKLLCDLGPAVMVGDSYLKKNKRKAVAVQ